MYKKSGFILSETIRVWNRGSVDRRTKVINVVLGLKSHLFSRLVLILRAIITETRNTWIGKTERGPLFVNKNEYDLGQQGVAPVHLGPWLIRRLISVPSPSTSVFSLSAGVSGFDKVGKRGFLFPKISIFLKYIRTLKRMVFFRLYYTSVSYCWGPSVWCGRKVKGLIRLFGPSPVRPLNWHKSSIFL